MITLTHKGKEYKIRRFLVIEPESLRHYEITIAPQSLCNDLDWEIDEDAALDDSIYVYVDDFYIDALPDILFKEIQKFDDYYKDYEMELKA